MMIGATVDGLTIKQRRAYRLIESHIRTRGYAPTVTELCARLNVTTGAVWKLLDTLAKKGWIVRQRGARQIRLLRYAKCPYCSDRKVA